MPRKTEQVAETLIIPEAVQQELTLLRGFRDLVAERVAYMFGAKALSSEMSEATKEQRKALTQLNKEFKGNLENYVRNGDFDGFSQAQAKIKEAREVLSKARKPHMAKISPLRKAIKYIDNVAIPDSLKELGVTVQPAFSLSEWVKKAVESKKRK
jgi:flagellar biosynthesis/type III secretory pathway protein FliH